MKGLLDPFNATTDALLVPNYRNIGHHQSYIALCKLLQLCILLHRFCA